MQLDAVEAGLAGAAGGVGEEAGQHLRQVADVRAVEVGHPLAEAVAEVLELARRERPLQLFRRQRQEALAHLVLRQVVGAEEGAVAVGDLEVAAEVGLRLRPPPDRQEVDDLDEEAGVAAAGAAHGLDQLGEAGEEAVVADAQQRAARDVADAGRLDDERPRLAVGEALVPVEHLVGDEALLGGAPGHHRRHPGALLELHGADPDGGEPEGGGRLLGGRPVAAGSSCRIRSGGFHMAGQYSDRPAAQSGGRSSSLAMTSFWISVVPS